MSLLLHGYFGPLNSESLLQPCSSIKGSEYLRSPHHFHFWTRSWTRSNNGYPSCYRKNSRLSALTGGVVKTLLHIHEAYFLSRPRLMFLLFKRVAIRGTNTLYYTTLFTPFHSPCANARAFLSFLQQTCTCSSARPFRWNVSHVQ